MERRTDLAGEAETDRRAFLAASLTSSLAMAGGLAAGYGTFVYLAGRYLYPSQDTSVWMFVTDVESLVPGQSMSFRSPTGAAVLVSRKADSPTDRPPVAEDFLALSSICPHLGCHVHPEPHNDRLFCPCHNGAFDMEGNATEGPPKLANQNLPNYPLMIEGGLLYINMPIASINARRDAGGTA